MNIKGINIYSHSIPLKEWPSKITKVYRFVTPEFKEKTIEFSCTLKQSKNEKIVIVEKDFFLAKFDEDCISNELSFQNIYWASEDGFIWKSKQWISLSNIFAEISILNV